jgi:hypothetical protein
VMFRDGIHRRYHHQYRIRYHAIPLRDKPAWPAPTG